MSKKTIILCDKCQKEVPLAPRSMSIYLDRTYNGTDHDNEYLALDLCLTCAYTVIEKVFHDSDGKTNKEILTKTGIKYYGS